MISNEEIDAVLAAHAAWKARFRDFLVGRAGMDIGTLGETGQCAFGTWLERYGAKFLQKEKFEQINARHAEFHKIAADIVAKLRAHDFEGARAAIATDGALEQASGTLADQLLKLKSIA